MKLNKRGSVAVVVILIAIVLTLISITIYLYSNGKIPAGNETVISGDKENNNIINVEEQIKVITDNYAIWSMKTDDDMYRPYSYVVTDLNQNGRLEIIASSCQGTGIYTWSKYYEVNKTFDGLEEIKRELPEGTSEADIIVKTAKVFIDREGNEYHYIFSDLIKNGAAEHYENKQDIVLKDGKLSENILAYKTTIYKDSVPEIKYQDIDLEDILPEEYEKVEDEKFEKLEYKNVNFEWLSQVDDDLDNVSGDALSKLLTKSYNGFKFTIPEVLNEAIKDNEVRHEAYKKALKDMMKSRKLPTEEDVELYYEKSMNMEDNKFAIYDIDNDNNDELIIEWVTAPTAGQLSFIYDYDVETGKFVNEFFDVPLLTFYDNGVIVALLSHNQGLAGGTFWPYYLYKYDKASDLYEPIAMVDAWDKSVAATDGNGNKYPEDVDKKGDGIIYYVIEDGDYENKVPVSKEYYEEWRSSYLDGAKEVKLEFVGFSEKNIEDIK